MTINSNGIHMKCSTCGFVGDDHNCVRVAGQNGITSYHCPVCYARWIYENIPQLELVSVTTSCINEGKEDDK